jgi:two-component system chemotaxis sensor kinase CheA
MPNKVMERGLTSPGAQLSGGEVFTFHIPQPGFLHGVEGYGGFWAAGWAWTWFARTARLCGAAMGVESKLRVGTTFRINFSLLLAIIDGMTVSVGEEIVTLPLLSIVEALCSKLLRRFRWVGEGRGELLSVCEGSNCR